MLPKDEQGRTVVDEWRIWLAELIWLPIGKLELEIKTLNIIIEAGGRANYDLENEVQNLEADLEDCENEHSSEENRLQHEIEDHESTIDALDIANGVLRTTIEDLLD